MFDKLIILQKALGFHCQLYKMRKYLWLNPTQLKELQKHKLKALVTHSYDKVPYYKRLFDCADIKPEDIKSVDDLRKIPITSRETLQALPMEEIVTKGTSIAQCINLRTSGSTGRPLNIFIRIRDQRSPRRLYDLRMHFENGRKLKDKVFAITMPYNFLQKQWFHPWLYRLTILREKYMSENENTDSILNELSFYKPDIILSYPSIIKEVALRIEGRKIKGINPRTIFSTGEILSKKDRVFISSTLKTEVFDYYACNECGIIAWECKTHNGYHIDSDNVIVELVKNNMPVPIGEEGEVVITAFNNYTMPFIRYRLGDIAVFSNERCPCGRSFPLIKVLKGRVADNLILPDGRKVSYHLLINKLDSIMGIVMYQIIQEKLDKVKIQIVRNEKFSSDTVSQVKEKCEETLGSGIDLAVEIVEDIPRSETAKYKTIVSHL
ncbi:phenylacetate--CoA ligase family protein [bacterium]|nr:phenylacetate--CoA ligase family protein [bacterium]